METKEIEVKENEAVNYEKEYKDIESKYKKLLSSYNKMKTSNEVIIDLSNEDNRKTLRELMAEGKVLVNKNDNRPFITSKQSSPIYDGAIRPVIHKIYIDDIITIAVKRYYEDYEIVDKGNRKFIKQVIWCYHKGYNVTSTLTEENLVYLYNNGLIDKSKITYSDIDVSTGTGYPTQALGSSIIEVMSEKLRRGKQYDKQINLSYSEDKEVKEVSSNKETVIIEPTIIESIKAEPVVEDTKNEEIIKEEVTIKLPENTGILESVDLSDISFDDIGL